MAGRGKGRGQVGLGWVGSPSTTHKGPQTHPPFPGFPSDRLPAPAPPPSHAYSTAHATHLMTWPMPSLNSKGSLRSRELSNFLPFCVQRGGQHGGRRHERAQESKVRGHSMPRAWGGALCGGGAESCNPGHGTAPFARAAAAASSPGPSWEAQPGPAPHPSHPTTTHGQRPGVVHRHRVSALGEGDTCICSGGVPAAARLVQARHVVVVDTPPGQPQKPRPPLSMQSSRPRALARAHHRRAWWLQRRRPWCRAVSRNTLMCDVRNRSFGGRDQRRSQQKVGKVG